MPLKSPYLPANRLLAANIQELLSKRHQTQQDLAVWCRHSGVWISKILKGSRGVKFSDLDRIADFFGLVPYQLFSPGISGLSERRSGLERRAQKDRRMGPGGRQLATLRHELNKLPAIASHDYPALHPSTSPLPEPIRAILADTSRKIADYYALTGGQDAVARAPRAAGAKGGRRTRRSARGQA